MFDTKQLETSKYWLPLVAAGTGFCLLIFCSVFYFLSRPCVILECTEITRAEKLARRSQTILQQPQSIKNLLAAYQEIDRAIALLDSIPVWSARYLEVQNSISIYQTRKESLQNLLTALKLRSQVISLAKNPPFPVTSWENFKSIWTEAIATLEAIPEKSEYYYFASEQIQEYREKLEFIEAEIAKEKKALKLLENARSRANFASESQNDANSFTDWQLVHSHWQVAIELLEKVPEATTVTPTAKQLKINLLPELNLAQKRRDLEEIAINNHRQAIATAKLAKQSQNERELTKTVAYWEDALNYLKLIPQNTFQYRQAQHLIAPYLYALNIAKQQRYFSLRLERAALDLEKLCSERMRICDYSLKNDVIQVIFTADYIEQVRQTALETQEENNIKDRVRVMDHIFSLETALKTIANNAKIRMELYNDDKILLLTYLPE